MNTRLITIVEQGDVVGEAMEQVNLRLIEGCTRVRHHVLDATLVHGEHIGVAFHHIDHILLGNLLLRLEDAIEFVGLVIDEGVGGVDVFLIDALGAYVHRAAGRFGVLFDGFDHRSDNEECRGEQSETEDQSDQPAQPLSIGSVFGGSLTPTQGYR